MPPLRPPEEQRYRIGQSLHVLIYARAHSIRHPRRLLDFAAMSAATRSSIDSPSNTLRKPAFGQARCTARNGFRELESIFIASSGGNNVQKLTEPKPNTFLLCSGIASLDLFRLRALSIDLATISYLLSMSLWWCDLVRACGS